MDPLGEGASTDPGLAFCSPEVQWEGWGADRWRRTLFPALGVYSLIQAWKAPRHALWPNSSLASLPSSFAKIRTLKEISSTLDPGHSGLHQPK